MSRLRARRRTICRSDGERGAVIMIVAISLGVLMVATAFSVDLGRQMLRRRDVQAVADVVALDLVRLVDGTRTKADLDSDTAWQNAFDNTLNDSRDRNGFPAGAGRVLTPVLGMFDEISRQFSAATLAVDVPDAVMVTASDVVDFAFMPGSRSVTRKAVAHRAQVEEAYFKVGSFLAAVDPQSTSLMGQVLNALIPGTSIGSFEGLVGTTIQLEQLGLYMPFGVVTPEQMASTQVSMHDLMLASIEALRRNGGNTAAITALEGMLSTASTVRNINLGEAVGIEAGGGDPAASAQIDLLQLLATSAFLANGQNAISIPNLMLNAGGVLTADVTLSLIEGEQRNQWGTQGDTAATKQLDLTITPHIQLISDPRSSNICNLPLAERLALNNLVNGVLSLVTCLGLPPLIPPGALNEYFSISIDAAPTLSVRAAAVEVEQHFDCSTNALTLTPLTPSVLELLSDIDFNVRASLLGSDLGDVLGVHIAAGAVSQGSIPPQTFIATDTDPNHRVFSPGSVQMGSNPLGLQDLLQFNTADVTVLNTPIPSVGTLLIDLVAPLLNEMLGELDDLLVTPLAEMLGISLGGAKLTPEELNCGGGGPALVQ